MASMPDHISYITDAEKEECRNVLRKYIVDNLITLDDIAAHLHMDKATLRKILTHPSHTWSLRSIKSVKAFVKDLHGSRA